MPASKNLVGKVFGRLTVQSIAGTNTHSQVEWLCLCECGNSLTVASAKLNAGHTQSCGCLKSEQAKITGKKTIKHCHAAQVTHGASKTRTYISWKSMWQRCINPNATGYKDYGGRGIKVCDRWKDFDLFLQDMGTRPEGKSLDRKNVNGDYELSNCRWANSKQQASNKQLKNVVGFQT